MSPQQRPVTSRIRVLMLLWRLTRGGGVPIVARGFLRHFDRDAFDVHVCTVRPHYQEDALGDLGEGITYHPLNLTGPRTVLLRAKAVVGSGRVARRVRPDLLHLHSGTASYGLGAALAGTGAQKILEVHDAPQSGRLSRGNRMLERALARRFGFAPLAHSRAVRDATAVAWGLPPSRIPIVPLGIDTDVFSPDLVGRAGTRAELGIDSDTPLVTYVARMVPEKRPELFVEVARRILVSRPDVRFALVGGGAGVEPLRHAVREAGIHGQVRVHGFVEDLVGIYRASDVFLSTSRYEGFGLAIAEAMAAGLPVVSTLVGGVEDVVGAAGILEPSDDPDRLAGHVLALLDDLGRRKKLAAVARARARDQLDVRATTRRFEGCYRELVS